MSRTRSPLVRFAVFGAAASVFLALDLVGLAYLGDWSTLGSVALQILSLTLVVGTWAYAMIALDERRDDLAESARAA